MKTTLRLIAIFSFFLIFFSVYAEQDQRKKITVIFSTGNEKEITLINSAIEEYNRSNKSVEVRLISHRWEGP